MGELASLWIIFPGIRKASAGKTIKRVAKTLLKRPTQKFEIRVSKKAEEGESG